MGDIIIEYNSSKLPFTQFILIFIMMLVFIVSYNTVSTQTLVENQDMTELYKMKGTKIWDNSRGSNILSYIKFPEELTERGIELFTKEEPYGLKVNFKGTTDIQMKYAAMSSDEAWISQSLILLSLIDNLDYIQYAIDDGNNNIIVSNIKRDYADSSTTSTLGFKASQIAKYKTRFKKFYDIYGK